MVRHRSRAHVIDCQSFTHIQLVSAFLKHGPTTADLASVLVTVENMTPRKVSSAGFRCFVKILGAVIAVGHIGTPVL
jgi:hypothetical protein